MDAQHSTFIETLNTFIVCGGLAVICGLATIMWWFFSLINSKVSKEDYRKDRDAHILEHKELQNKLDAIKDEQSKIGSSISSIDAKLGVVIAEKDLALKALLASLNLGNK